MGSPSFSPAGTRLYREGDDPFDSVGWAFTVAKPRYPNQWGPGVVEINVVGPNLIQSVIISVEEMRQLCEMFHEWDKKNATG